MTLIDSRPPAGTVPRKLWADLTRKCQLACMHCMNDSGAAGEHGTMTADDWARVLVEARDLGTEQIRIIGGEPTMHPGAPALVRHALALGLTVEVFTNLVHVTPDWWELFQASGVSVATSYYSDDPAEHNAITGRPSHRLTRANIVRAIELGVRLRAGIVDTGGGQSVEAARRDLEAIGVPRITIDRVRAIGRAAGADAPTASELCGHCGDGRASIGPDGTVSPCAMSSWMSVGNVHDTSLADIVGGAAMAEATSSIVAAPRAGGCEPDQECSPGTPGSGCTLKK